MYALTAVWTNDEVNVDAVAAALPAWTLTQGGTIVLPESALANPWVIEGPLGPVSNRPPGVTAAAVPAYIVAGRSTFSNSPASASAVLITAAALAFLSLTLTTLVPIRLAVPITVVVALGTATWPISSAELWPHAIGQLAAAVSLYGLATERYMLSGLAFGYGILTRPPTALIPAVIGLNEWRIKRETVPLLKIAIPSAIGLSLLLIYNRAIFGRFSLSGGYSPDFAENLAAMPISAYALNLVKTFVWPPNGLFLWTPAVLVALLDVPRVWRSTPSWARSSFVAGLFYLIIHARLNRASGGLAFNYRYPLEALVLWAPILAVAAQSLINRSSITRLLLIGSALLSILLQGLYVFTLTCVMQAPSETLCSLGM